MMIVTLFASGTVLASDYSAGMKAYMDGDFQAAYEHWRKGADDGDAKSMFNLGWMHEQRLIANAQTAEAANWYRQAGAHGYPAAEFHLAQMLKAQQGNTSTTEQLVRSSASKGYSPARRALGQTEKSVSEAPVASSPVIASEAAEVPITSPADSNERAFLDQNWISAQQPGRWTIQLLAFEDMMKVYDFIEEHGLRETAAYFSEKDEGGTLYKLIYGIYESREQADRARQILPTNLKQHGPWLRTLGSVQTVIAGN